MQRGRQTVTPAMASRCFCPPESRSGDAFALSARLTVSSISRTRLQISAGSAARISRPKAQSSSTVVPII
jgi:hypothetical protein